MTKGDVKNAVQAVTDDPGIFVCGVSDSPPGIMLHQTDDNAAPVSLASLSKGLPEPFRSEASGGTGVKMHHKLVVIDFDKPTARVYTVICNFSATANTKNAAAKPWWDKFWTDAVKTRERQMFA